jgi:uncharacterized membrane-anchored protein YhcB (DUF1043 family)
MRQRMSMHDWQEFKSHFLTAANYLLPNGSAQHRFSQRVSELEELHPEADNPPFNAMAHRALEMLQQELQE